MARYYFPMTSDGVFREDPVGSDHETPDAAVREGHIVLREMAMERLKQGESNFEEAVDVKDEHGATLGHHKISVTSTDRL